MKMDTLYDSRTFLMIPDRTDSGLLREWHRMDGNEVLDGNLREGHLHLPTRYTTQPFDYCFSED